jgi:putative polyketide hydroxylase
MELHWKGDRTELAKMAIADPLVTGFGYQYTAGALIDPRAELPSLDNVEENLDGSPGTRVPHAWAQRKGERISTLDLAGPGFALVTGPAGAGWHRAAEQAGQRTGVPVAVHRLGPLADPGDDDLVTDTTQWLTATGIEPDGALLIRPDNVVAWRTATAPDDPGLALRHVLHQLLSR